MVIPLAAGYCYSTVTHMSLLSALTSKETFYIIIYAVPTRTHKLLFNIVMFYYRVHLIAGLRGVLIFNGRMYAVIRVFLYKNHRLNLSTHSEM